LAAQAAAGLAHVHARGLVHRDVKPKNLLLGRDGTLKVSDFGIARLVDGTRLTQVGTVLGTAAYLAPEQAAGSETTGAADVYALGVVMYELLTGTLPYGAPTLGELVPIELASLLLACLLDDPDRRPSAREVELMLRGEVDAPTRVLAPASALPTAILPRARPHRRLVLIAATAVGLTALPLGLAFGLGAGGLSPTPKPRLARIAPVPSSATPAGAATNLARWLRAHSR
jgi:serine/threonine protein kinase